jgi:hypothetical protein
VFTRILPPGISAGRNPVGPLVALPAANTGVFNMRGQPGSFQARYAQLSTAEKVRFWIGVLVFLPACIWVITLLPDSRSSSAPVAPTAVSTASSGMPAGWREACDYVYTYGAGRLSDDQCAKLVQDRPAGWPEAEWVRRIKVSNQQAECIREARTAQGKDACRMQYPMNW